MGNTGPHRTCPDQVVGIEVGAEQLTASRLCQGVTADFRSADFERSSVKSLVIHSQRSSLTVSLDGGGLAYVSLVALAEVSGPESG